MEAEKYPVICYSLPAAAFVTLDIYTNIGAKVVTLVESVQEAGFHAVEWDGRDAEGERMPNGWYLYRLDLTTCKHVRLIPLVSESQALA